MTDIVTRLRTWVHAVDALPASDLMDEAADEIARLRLTGAEREAVNAALGWCDDRDTKTITILRSLLARTGGER